MKIGFIGAGNMAGAMIRGMVSSGFVEAGSLWVYDLSEQAMDTLTASVAVNRCAAAADVVQAADTVIFAVKPHVMGTVMGQLASLLTGGDKLVVSIAAGLSLDTLAGYIGGDKAPIIRVMPNVNMLVGLAMSGVCANPATSPEQVDSVLDLLRSVGAAVTIPEKDMSIFCAISGCSPAYAYLFIDALSRSAVKHGLSKKAATDIAAQAVLGSAKMVLDSDKTPWDLIDTVCSPAGTTVAGLLAMQDHGFQAAVTHGIDAAVARDKELQQQA